MAQKARLGRERPRPPGLDKRGALRIILATLIVTGSLGLRAWGTYSGKIWGDVATRIADLATVALVILGVLLWPRRTRRAEEGAPSRVSRFGEVVGVAVVVSAALYSFPAVTPSSSDAAACRNAQVHDTKFLATTVDRGANVRQGPSQDTVQIARLAGDCSVGFNGYCIGTPQQDLAVPVFDSRWLILPAGRGFVSAAVVQSQRSERSLRQRPCPGGRRPPGPPRIALDGLQPDGTIRATASSTGAYVVGFALYQPMQTSGDPLIQPIGLDQSPGDGFTVEYNPTTAAAQLPLSSGEVDLVAAPCLAADIPVPFNPPAISLASLRFTYEHGRLQAVPGVPASASQADRLVRATCTYVPPPT